MNTMLIEEGLMSYLLNVGDLQSYISDRIYPLTLPQNPTLPAIVYEKVDADHIKSHQGSSGLVRPILRFNCWASVYAQSKVLAELLRLTLEGYRGRIGGVHGLNLYGSLSQNERDEYNASLDLYCVILDYALWHDEEKPSGISAEPLATSMRGKHWIDIIVFGDGETKIFSTEYTFKENSLQVRVRGTYQTRNVHYTESAGRGSITFATAPPNGWPIEKRYVID